VEIEIMACLGVTVDGSDVFCRISLSSFNGQLRLHKLISEVLIEDGGLTYLMFAFCELGARSKLDEAFGFFDMRGARFGFVILVLGRCHHY
jgi:hypothetical protein